MIIPGLSELLDTEEPASLPSWTLAPHSLSFTGITTSIFVLCRHFKDFRCVWSLPAPYFSTETVLMRNSSLFVLEVGGHLWGGAQEPRSLSTADVIDAFFPLDSD